MERLIVAGDKIVVTEWIHGRIADVFTFRNGKVIQMRLFGERQEAQTWAGAQASVPRSQGTAST